MESLRTLSPHTQFVALAFLVAACSDGSADSGDSSTSSATGASTMGATAGSVGGGSSTSSVTNSTSTANVSSTASGTASDTGTVSSTTASATTTSSSTTSSTPGTTGSGGAGGTTTESSSTGGDSSSAVTTGSMAAGGTGAQSMDTWTNFAQGFFQDYCVSCHDADMTNNRGGDQTQLDVVMEWSDGIACGVATAEIRATLGCAQGDPAASQFPAGNGASPSDEERARLVAWIEAGMPE